MSEIKRYDYTQDTKGYELGPAYMEECDLGDYVKYDDHLAAISAKDAQIRILRAQLDVLKAVVENYQGVE
jgi:hypothetical protein